MFLIGEKIKYISEELQGTEIHTEQQMAHVKTMFMMWDSKANHSCGGKIATSISCS